MDETTSVALPARLHDIADELRSADREEQLELLLGYADALPPLPAAIAEDRSQLDHVHECMTPVFIYAEPHGPGVRFHFDVPPESPTVRGFAEILRSGTEGATVHEILALPNDLANHLGLQQTLTPRRLNGMWHMLAHMKRLVAA